VANAPERCSCLDASAVFMSQRGDSGIGSMPNTSAAPGMTATPSMVRQACVGASMRSMT